MTHFFSQNQRLTHFIPHYNQNLCSFISLASTPQLPFQSQFELLLQRSKLERLFQYQEYLRHLTLQSATSQYSCYKESLPPIIEKYEEDLFNEKSSNLTTPVFEEKIDYVEEIKKEDIIPTKVEENETCSLKSELRIQVEGMVNFFLKTFGKSDKKEISEERAQYKENQKLLKLFDALSGKYHSASKNKEDMTRFVLRKALTYLRDVLRSEHKTSAKGASILLCKKYFSERFNELIHEMNDAVSMENYDKLLGFLLPYKKNSRNKTANMSFILEIFASKNFYQDYLGFLQNFDEILQLDNENRMKKFVDFLINCIENNSCHKIKNFKRLPWLEAWVENTKKIAHRLLNAKDWTESIHNSPEIHVERNQIRKQTKKD